MQAPSKPKDRLVRFGPFGVNFQERKLTKDGYRIRLQDQPFQFLALLLERPGQLITREEVRQKLWPDNTFVQFDDSLHTTVRKLREALNDSAQNPRFFETVRGRGYRFVAPVVGELESQSPPATFRFRPKLYVWLAIVTITLTGVLALYESLRRSGPKVMHQDTVVVGNFANNTGDSIFDETLQTALGVSLRQSPFLKLLPESQISTTLQEMTIPEGTRLTSGATRELCQRTNSKAYVEASISTFGSGYVLNLKAINCQNGDVLAHEQTRATIKEQVLDKLGDAVSRLRGELGESLETIQRFDLPLAEATTSSLEALKSYSLARKTSGKRGHAAAIAYDQRAIAIDPNFAMGYHALGDDYLSVQQPARASEFYNLAFKLRANASERERLRIAADFYQNVTGELDKAVQTYQEETESYQKEEGAFGDLSLVYSQLGQYDKAEQAERESLRLNSDVVSSHDSLAFTTLALQHFDASKAILDAAPPEKVEHYLFHTAVYAHAFLTDDLTTMEKEWQWFANNSRHENYGLALLSDTEAFSGRLNKARKLTKRAVESAIKFDSTENGAAWLAISAQREAAFGNSNEARQQAKNALQLAPASAGVKAEASLALAMAGDTERSESIIRELEKRFPLDTQVQSLWVPTIRAQLALSMGSPSQALRILPADSSLDLALLLFADNMSCLNLPYVRGQAYLAAGDWRAASAEFQKILYHSGLVWNCWTGALARLGLARADYMEARSSRSQNADDARRRALAAYQAFLNLWRNADPEIPALKQAKKEFEQLQGFSESAHFGYRPPRTAAGAKVVPVKSG